MTWPQWVLVAFLVLQYLGASLTLRSVARGDVTRYDRAATAIAAALGTAIYAWLIYLVTTL